MREEKVQPLVIYGAGGMGREVVQLIEGINALKPRYELWGYVVGRDYYFPGENVNGIPLIGDEDWLVAHKGEVLCTCAIGEAHARASTQRRLVERGIRFESLVDPLVWIPATSTLGDGCVIFCDSRISANCTLGNGVFLNCGVTVGHDAAIGDYTCVMPTTGISGRCLIGEEVNIGGHAFIVPGKKVGDRATVAAGSIVFSHVREGTTVLGNPAKRMRCLEGQA